MTWAAIAAGLLVSLTALAASYVLGAVHAFQRWQRHEIAHGRGWPPMPRPIPPPPKPPPRPPMP